MSVKVTPLHGTKYFAIGKESGNEEMFESQQEAKEMLDSWKIFDTEEGFIDKYEIEKRVYNKGKLINSEVVYKDIL